MNNIGGGGGGGGDDSDVIKKYALKWGIGCDWWPVVMRHIDFSLCVSIVLRVLVLCGRDRVISKAGYEYLFSAN